MGRQSVNFGNVLRWNVAILIGGCAALAAVSSGYAESKESSSAKPSKQSIPELIRQLDHKSYIVRNAAGRQLSRLGGDAVAPLAKTARTGSLEASARAIAILEHIYTDPESSEKTVERVELALESLRESKRAQAGGRAAQVLARHDDLRERRALAAVKRLGGIVRYYDTEMLLGGAPPGNPGVDADQRQISYILLGDQWKGGDDAVKYLKRIVGLRNLYVAQNKKFQPISAKARDELEKSIPNLSIQLRGLACLGVRGSPTNINGTGCTVSSVDKGSAADLAKLKAYDQISRFAGKPVEDFQGLVKLIADHSPGEKVKVEVIRPDGGTMRKLTLTVELQGWKK